MGHVWVWRAEFDPAQCVGEKGSKIEECQRRDSVSDVQNVEHDGISVQDILEDVSTIHGL